VTAARRPTGGGRIRREERPPWPSWVWLLSLSAQGSLVSLRRLWVPRRTALARTGAYSRADPLIRHDRDPLAPIRPAMWNSAMPSGPVPARSPAAPSDRMLATWLTTCRRAGRPGLPTRLGAPAGGRAARSGPTPNTSTVTAPVKPGSGVLSADREHRDRGPWKGTCGDDARRPRQQDGPTIDFWPRGHYQRPVQSACGQPMRRGCSSAGLLH
jgi:hypothetical protein